MKNSQTLKERGGRLCLLMLTLLFSATFQVTAQETKVVRDLQLWSGASIQKSFGKNWTVSLEEEVRFKHNISEINNYFTEAGLRYRISKNFALEGGYRFTRDKKKDGNYETLTRYNLDLRYKGKLDFITIYYRLRYQKEVEGWNLLDQSLPYEKYVRNRVKIGYTDLQKIEPYVSAEVFQLFTPDQYPEFQYIRVQGGITYDIPKAGSFNIAFGINREFSSVEPATIYNLKIRYTYKF